MAKAYFLPLVSLPVVIDESGEYVTRCGDVVTVTIVSTKHDMGCHGFYNAGGVSESWHKSGRLYAGTESFNDIVRKA
ncbi:hypothetical protein phiOC_p080 [Ochrobactrum phage vB_OspM_OC]|nr:hypothetical protein phiOC_p080 [Ochrobactrum phage vB_OspM_OC]